MKLTVALALVIATLSWPESFAHANPAAMARGGTSKFSGAYMDLKCFNATDTGAHAGPNVVKGALSSEERHYMGGVINRINSLSGSNLLTDRVKISVYDIEKGGKPWGKNTSSATTSNSSIALVSHGTAGSTTAHFAHEMGHIAGLRGFYGSYQSRFKGDVCKVSHYCTANKNANPRNEEFAEVFATYLHSPNILKQKCPAQFEWMAKNVFPKGDPKDCNGNQLWKDTDNATPGSSDGSYDEDQSAMNSRPGPNGANGIQDIINAIMQQQQETGALEPAPAAAPVPFTNGPNVNDGSVPADTIPEVIINNPNPGAN